MSPLFMIIMQTQLQGHMEQFFENVSSAKTAIEFTVRFERLDLNVGFNSSLGVLNQVLHQ